MSVRDRATKTECKRGWWIEKSKKMRGIRVGGKKGEGRREERELGHRAIDAFG